MAIPSFTLPLGSSVITGRAGETADVIFWDDFVMSSVSTDVAAYGNLGIWRLNKHANTGNDKGTAVINESTLQNGVMQITGSALNGGTCALNDNVTLYPNFNITYGPYGQTYFEVRMQTSSVAEQIWFGFASNSTGKGTGEADTDPVSSAATDYILFKVVAADVKCQASFYDTVAEAAAVGTLTDTGADITAATWHTFAIHITNDGPGLKADFWVDGTLKESLTDNLPAAGTMLFPTLVVAQISTAATTVASFDYVLCATKRTD